MTRKLNLRIWRGDATDGGLKDVVGPVDGNLQLLLVHALDHGAELGQLLLVAGGDLFHVARLDASHVGDRVEQVGVEAAVDSLARLGVVLGDRLDDPGVRLPDRAEAVLVDHRHRRDAAGLQADVHVVERRRPAQRGLHHVVDGLLLAQDPKLELTGVGQGVQPRRRRAVDVGAPHVPARSPERLGVEALLGEQGLAAVGLLAVVAPRRPVDRAVGLALGVEPVGVAQIVGLHGVIHRVQLVVVASVVGLDDPARQHVAGRAALQEALVVLDRGQDRKSVV